VTFTGAKFLSTPAAIFASVKWTLLPAIEQPNSVKQMINKTKKWFLFLTPMHPP
jgi:hypothetical protein